LMGLPQNATFPIDVTMIRPAVWLYNSTDFEKHPFANLVTHDFARAITRKVDDTWNMIFVDTQIDNIPFMVESGQEEAFSTFLNNSFNKEYVKFGIKASVQTIIECGIGTLSIGPLEFKTTIEQKGNLSILQGAVTDIANRICKS